MQCAQNAAKRFRAVATQATLTVLCHLQDYRFGGVKFDMCSNINFHGPYEQTYVNKELPYTQGKILAADDSSNPGIMTVQASRQGQDLHVMAHNNAPSHLIRHFAQIAIA